ncbi:tyrosine-type recombinase/integrase [Lachnospiraceae bacterium KGMB03038]|nr:tyrosine-type recombinase/integrase [Lachnospiraceae bacterium KGMB03038]
MNMLSKESIVEFAADLREKEKAASTIVKYRKAAERFGEYLAGREITKERLLEYRSCLTETFQAQTVNGNLSAINAYLDFRGLSECKVKLLKVQRQAFLDETKELSEEEYKRLLREARKRKDQRLYLILMTLCSTGIRISELRYITVEAARTGRARIQLKGKNRIVLIPRELRVKLLRYAKEKEIESGHIFRTRSGNMVDRSNICHDMKKLCQMGQVDPRKVFPHNLRHLFARTFYEVEKNLAHLADVLGHSKIETTRIYVAVSASAHERTLEKMGLVI